MSIMDVSFFKILGFKNRPKSPWDKFYKKSDMNITSPNKSIYRFLKDKADKENYGNHIAITYFNTHTKEHYLSYYI